MRESGCNLKRVEKKSGEGESVGAVRCVESKD